MKMSKMYMPTLREIPSEAEIPSHQLMLRAGMIRKLVSGVYSYLPLGYRAIKKVEQIVREEMDRADSQELLMSAIQPRELWEESGRWANFGPEMWKLKDRNNREFCLGPTHEEYFTNLIKDEIKSYKQLPLNLYQIQTKYRDEKRPRFGLMRCREFIMKDAYSFDVDEEAMKVAYQKMWDAYDKIFTRLKLNYKVVEGDTGAMGGKVSHEFMAVSDIGEGVLAYCKNCEYAATDEKAKVVYKSTESTEVLKNTEEVYTPNMKTIDELCEFLDITGDKCGKALVYNANGETVVVIIPGNRELNETKLANYLGIASHELIMAEEDVIKDISHSNKGFTGPIGLKEGVKILVDKSITGINNIVVGGNKTDYHIINANFGRDFTGEVVEDLMMIEEGDLCPVCGQPIYLQRGIEVGNIFQLGTKYSGSLSANFLDENGKAQLFYMGSYGVGVSRTVAAVIEQYHDDKGIVWPFVIAPYHVIVTVMNIKKEEQVELGESIYNSLIERGIETLLDNRNERAGVKFNDRELIGIPVQITVGKRADEGIVEFSLRKGGEKLEIKTEEIDSLIQKAFDEEGFSL
ncbi:MAG: proline--tRNA ligase [Gudongella sp.]|nr:proline--tRNA ligase [Gudongella sp.]